jgi:hypothetical protein
MCVIALHSMFLCSDMPPPHHSSSDWPGLFFGPNLSRIKDPNILHPGHTSYLPAYEDETECSEMLAFKLQIPGNHPEERIQHSEHSKSLKSRMLYRSQHFYTVKYTTYYVIVQKKLMYLDLKLKEMLIECIKCTLNGVNVVSLTLNSSVM